RAEASNASSIATPTATSKPAICAWAPVWRAKGGWRKATLSILCRWISSSPRSRARNNGLARSARLLQQPRRKHSRPFDQSVILGQIAEPERGQTALVRPEQFAGAAQFQVRFGNAKAITGFL